MAKYKLEKIDQDTFKKIDTMEEVTVLNVKELEKQKAALETEVSRLSDELAKVNEILTEYNKLP